MGSIPTIPTIFNWSVEKKVVAFVDVQDNVSNRYSMKQAVFKKLQTSSAETSDIKQQVGEG